VLPVAERGLGFDLEETLVPRELPNKIILQPQSDVKVGNRRLDASRLQKSSRCWNRRSLHSDCHPAGRKIGARRGPRSVLGRDDKFTGSRTADGG